MYKIIIQFISFLLVINLNLLRAEEKINYRKILDFEDLKYWKGLKADINIKKSGKQSGKWVNPLENTRIDCRVVPKDFSKYNAVRLWVYSNKAKNFKFAFIFQSENEDTSGWDYYMRHFVVNWKGWKEFIIPFEKFMVRREPIGWNKIDRIRFASTGYALRGDQPVDVILNFDKIELLKLDDKFFKARQKKIMGFEEVSVWSGLVSDNRYVKEGKYSGKWINTDKVTRIDCTDLPKNWSKYNALQFWLYSKVANNAGFEIVLVSDNNKTPRDDYFHYGITVDWTGWKKIVIPFDKFIEKYEPVGWWKIEKIRFAALGYGHTPKKNTELYFDDLKLVNIKVVPTLVLRKHYYKENKYINYFKFLVKNVSRKQVEYNIDIKKIPGFDVSVLNKSGIINIGKKKAVEIFYILRRKAKRIQKNKLPYERSLVSFKVGDSLEKRELKIYYPFDVAKEHPFVFLSDNEIKKIKEKVRKYEWAKSAMEAMEKTAYKYSRGSIPEETGGDFHERIGSYEITRKHINFARAARYYSILYRITGKEKYAASAKEILLGYTKIYPKLKKSDKYGKVGDSADPTGGKFSVQLISDAKWDIFMAHTYDLIYDKFTEKERKKIEYIFRDQAEMIMKDKRGAHNFQAIYNSALAVMGYVLQDPAYIDYALNDKSNGFLSLQLKQSFTKDMIYYERSPHYHHFILSYLTYLLEAVYHSHFNIYKWKGVKKMYDVLLDIADKEYETVYVNDGGYFNFTEQKRGWPYIIAYKRYNDEDYLWIIRKLSHTAPDALLYLPGKIYADDSSTKTVNKNNYDSFYFPDTEWGFLRTKNNNFGDFYLMLKYDQYYSSHTHLDRLGLIVKAFGKFILPDAGSVKYGNPAQKPWFRSTLSHNTILVDMLPHSFTASTHLNYFYNSNNFQAISASANGIIEDTSVKINREVFLIDNSYVFDLVSAFDESGKKHKYDLVYHFDGKPNYRSFKPKSAKNIYESFSENYAYIENFSVYMLKKKNKDIVVDYNISGNNFVRFWNKGLKGLKIITGAGPIANKKERIREEKCPLILLRYDNTSKARYISIIQPIKNKTDKIRRVKLLINSEYAFLVKVLKKDGTIEYLMKSKNGVDSNEFTSDGSFAYLKVNNGKLYNIVILNGKKIKYNGVNLNLKRKSYLAISYDSSKNKYLTQNLKSTRVVGVLTADLLNGSKKLKLNLK